MGRGDSPRLSECERNDSCECRASCWEVVVGQGAPVLTAALEQWALLSRESEAGGGRTQPGLSRDRPASRCFRPPLQRGTLKVRTCPAGGPAKASSWNPQPLAPAPSLPGSFGILDSSVQVLVRAPCLPGPHLAARSLRSDLAIASTAPARPVSIATWPHLWAGEIRAFGFPEAGLCAHPPLPRFAAFVSPEGKDDRPPPVVAG